MFYTIDCVFHLQYDFYKKFVIILCKWPEESCQWQKLQLKYQGKPSWAYQVWNENFQTTGNIFLRAYFGPGGLMNILSIFDSYSSNGQFWIVCSLLHFVWFDMGQFYDSFLSNRNRRNHAITARDHVTWSPSGSKSKATWKQVGIKATWLQKDICNTVWLPVKIGFITVHGHSEGHIAASQEFG